MELVGGGGVCPSGLGGERKLWWMLVRMVAPTLIAVKYNRRSACLVALCASLGAGSKP